MSTYVFMRILESAPRRYDLGMRILSFGRLDNAYDRLASHIQNGQRVLDLGCGTGALSLRAAKRGARVKGIDVNVAMLEMASGNARKAALEDRVRFREMGVAELDEEPPKSYDAVMCGLSLSELSEDEFGYALIQTARILRPDGLLLVADETQPHGLIRRTVHRLIRIPLVVLAYLVTQQSTRPVAGLAEKIADAGFSILSIRSNLLGSFVEIVARK